MTNPSRVQVDDDHASGAVQDGMALLRALAVAPQGDLIPLKQKAKVWVDRFDEAQESVRQLQRHRMAPDRAVDGWVLDMFGATESAISREQLVDEFVARYRKERRLVDNDRHAGPWLFEFELQRGDGNLPELVALTGAGVHPDAFARHCQDWLPQWRHDPYLAAVFDERRDVDAWHPIWFGSSALFDRLLDVASRFRGESDYWVNAVALPGDGQQAMRGLFILHANAGMLDDPKPPPGMRQDQRLMVVLALAWRQLEHQIKSLARLSEADRRDMIQLLAPGLLHHEIGSLMNSFVSQAITLRTQLDELAQANPEHPQLQQHGLLAADIAIHAQRLFAVTDAFNNLDKRAAVEDTDLDKVCTGVRLLLRHRLGQCGVDLSWDAPAFVSIQLHTDVVLLSQALLNLINNALNAFSEAQSRPPRLIRIEAQWAVSGRLMIAVLNNGPAIAADSQRYLFQRGYTTRAQGHGQGLYLSRLIARYLGGELTTMEPAALPVNFQVGFRFNFLRNLPAHQGVARATLKPTAR